MGAGGGAVRRAGGRLRRLARSRTASRDPGEQPNILLVMTDQQRWDALGCVSDWVRTPHMDRIAAEGVLFRQAYTNSPLCIPARVSLSLGRYPHNHGVWGNRRYTLPASAPTWMRAVQEAGYATSVFGKTHLHPHKGDLRDREPLMHAYGLEHVDEIAGPRASVRCRSNLTDLWEQAGLYDVYRRDIKGRLRDVPWVARPSPLPLDLYPDVYVGRQAATHLRTYSGDRPWFCWVSFSGPHEPWDVPEPYASRYDPGAMPAPLRVEDPGPRSRPRGSLDDRLADPVPFREGEVGRLRANYAGNLELIDDQVGGLLEVVAERGELDRTVIALVSDHGEMNGDFGLLYKQNFLDPAVRVPFAVRLPDSHPDRTPGLVSDALVELMDLGATLGELAGAQPADRSYARSVVPVLTGRAVAHRSHVVSELKGEVMVSTDEWKCVLNASGEIYLLVDRSADPQETRNIAGSPDAADAENTMRRTALQALLSSMQ
ncbi:MAG TPA: sulfatase-like hydrolase/transferase [Actinomycetes bacterium]